MTKLLWDILMWLWVRRAKKSYGGPGKSGELFNTASFQTVVGKTTGQTVGDQTARTWLVRGGYFPGHGGCHWYTSMTAPEFGNYRKYTQWILARLAESDHACLTGDCDHCSKWDCYDTLVYDFLDAPPEPEETP